MAKKTGRLSAMNHLFDWSVASNGLINEIQQRLDRKYVAWKLPFPMKYTVDEPQNRALRSFCVERLVCKMILLSSVATEVESPTGLLRCYCVITESDIWGSEVGLVFDPMEWDKMLVRNIQTPTYIERTTPADRTLFESFGVPIPPLVSSIYFSHEVDDRDEDVSFAGGFHALWLDL